MQEKRVVKQTESDQTPKAVTRQRPPTRRQESSHAIDPGHLPFSTQLLGLRPPPDLRLSTLSQEQRMPTIQLRQGEKTTPVQRKEAVLPQPWGNQIPPELRLSPPVQSQQEGDVAQGQVEPLQRKNITGLPDTLKAGVEGLSGMAMDDVQVHYNSSKPAQVQALAFTQGTDIYVGPSQERHLPHEAWHAVQQKQGRVKPTLQAKNASINDDKGLEKEADVMGARAYVASSQAARPVSEP